LKSLNGFFYSSAGKGLRRDTLYSVLWVMDRLGLTRIQYRVCLLRYGRNKTQEQIAKRLGITQQMVSLHLAAAARKYPALAVIEQQKARRRQVRMAV
jgi:DNA-binding CsgD family transcriptional regulator